MTTRLSTRVREYVEAVVRRIDAGDVDVVSVVVFGSAVTGGFADAVSDVDMILVVADGTSADARVRLRADIEALEVRHGFRDVVVQPPSRLDAFAATVTANVRSFFICTRSDLLSGDPARLLGIGPFQALFVDRVVLPSILHSAVTAGGEDLLPRVPVRPIRRADVFIAWFGLFNQVLLSAALFPFVEPATKYAMDALKRSVHSCYFCYHGRPAGLEREVAFFQAALGRSRTLERLLELRQSYRKSFAFVLACLPAIAALHIRTAADNAFPRQPGARA